MYDIKSKTFEYILPEYNDVPALIDGLVEYVNSTTDHPLLVAAIVHYQLVTIHPFEDGNGRTARLLSGYILDINGFGFNGIGSLEEYFAYDVNEYYESLHMILPSLYYDGCDNPPHAEIWLNYFLRMVLLYSNKICEMSDNAFSDEINSSLSYLKEREKELLLFLLKIKDKEFTPIKISKDMQVTNKTITNRLSVLVKAGFIVPIIINERIRSYKLSECSKENDKKIRKVLA